MLPRRRLCCPRCCVVGDSPATHPHTSHGGSGAASSVSGRGIYDVGGSIPSFTRVCVQSCFKTVTWFFSQPASSSEECSSVGRRNMRSVACRRVRIPSRQAHCCVLCCLVVLPWCCGSLLCVGPILTSRCFCNHDQAVVWLSMTLTGDRVCGFMEDTGVEFAVLVVLFLQRLSLERRQTCTR